MISADIFYLLLIAILASAWVASRYIAYKQAAFKQYLDTIVKLNEKE